MCTMHSKRHTWTLVVHVKRYMSMIYAKRYTFVNNAPKGCSYTMHARR